MTESKAANEGRERNIEREVECGQGGKAKYDHGRTPNHRQSEHARENNGHEPELERELKIVIVDVLWVNDGGVGFDIDINEGPSGPTEPCETMESDAPDLKALRVGA